MTENRGVFRKSRGGGERSKKWYVEFRDHLDRVHRTPAFTDRRASAEYLRQLRLLVDAGCPGSTFPPRPGRTSNACPRPTYAGSLRSSAY